ncbi:hypothetical protein RCL1_003031 [Eukaryota sp. TZLM3-RCL]
MLVSELPSDFLQRLSSFIDSCHSTYHCVASVRSELLSSGYYELSLTASHWNLQAGNKYFVTSGQSTLFSFAIGSQFNPDSSKFSLVASHSDSPALKIKPKAVIKSSPANVTQLTTSVYGGPLTHTWFDRDLTIAGKIIFEKDQKISSKLVYIPRPVCLLPNLAIHLQKDKKDTISIDKDKEIHPIFSITPIENEEKKIKQSNSSIKSSENSNEPLLDLLSEISGVDAQSIIHFDLELRDCQSSSFVGANKEIFCGQGLDNKIAVFTSLEAIKTLETLDFSDIKGIIVFDHEEIGSCSDRGAASIFLEQVIQRVYLELNGHLPSFSAFLSRSIVISCDQGHVTHHAHLDRTDSQHGITIGKGPSIKLSPKIKYVTDHDVLALFSSLSTDLSVPLQWSMGKESVPGGSTVGPKLSAQSMTRVLDMGIGLFAMHSIRESCSVVDVWYLAKILAGFFSRNDLIQIEHEW